ncbi:MAG: penicillin acylase family protein, partial [Gemmatimonadota bacterium]
MRRVLIPLLAAAVTGCAPARQLATGIFGTTADRWASEVVIHRDSWGTPHVLGRTDAAVMFGAAFAQAEDRYPQLEEAVLWALGRAAEVHGPAALANDALRRALQVERLARAEYDGEPEERRVLWDAWAAGLNLFLSAHPEVPRHVVRFEPWWVFALSRPGDAAMVVDGVRLGDVLATASGGALQARPEGPGEAEGLRALDGTAEVEEGEQAGNAQEAQEPDAAAWNLLPGASAWAVAPARTADGRTLLAARGAVGVFAREQRWEVHLLSREGWHFAGVSVPGAPLPHSGHNEHLGWVHTASIADAADAFEVRFEDPDEPLHYRWADGWRRAEAWEDTVWVAGPAGPQARVLHFTRTHHGPVIRLDGDGRGVAVRLPRHEEGG